MRPVILTAVVVCGLATACSIRSERTVVEKPTTTPATTTVYTDPAPPATATTVYTTR